jgi:hypothetical protein
MDNAYKRSDPRGQQLASHRSDFKLSAILPAVALICPQSLAGRLERLLAET